MGYSGRMESIASPTKIVWETSRNGDSARSDFESNGHAITARASYYPTSGWTVWVYVDHKSASQAFSFATFHDADAKAAELVRGVILKSANSDKAAKESLLTVSA
jgi:hypothetical protein